MMIMLDRDGVINVETRQYIKSPEEWIEIPGSIKAIADLKNAGHTVVVATNQSGIARGLYTHEILADIHKKMHGLLALYNVRLDGVYYCPHHPDDHCDCRKPKPGLLQKISRDFSFDPDQAIMVGDSWRDLEAGMKVGATPVLVRTGNGELTISAQGHNLEKIAIYDDLAAFSKAILA